MRLAFGDLLGLDVTCAVLANAQAALLIVGDGGKALAATLLKQGTLSLLPEGQRILFGFSIQTAPFPLLVGGLMTERNTLFDKLSLFAWVEDNAILEPRAEVFGLTPFGEQPVLFLRDLDLDRPVEAWIATSQPMQWLRVAGVLMADPTYGGDGQTYVPDEGALAALRLMLPSDAAPFIQGLSYEVAQGQSLRAALRKRRRLTDGALMHLSDGWRVLAHAVPFMRVNPSAVNQPSDVAAALRIDMPRAW